MYKRVDGIEDYVIEGFSYMNQDDIEEYVSVDFHNSSLVLITLDNSPEVAVHLEDIPNLIKALQSTYNHVKG